MQQLVQVGVAMAAFCAMLGNAIAASDETATENRPIDARVLRVKLEGIIDLKLKQGAVPMLVISGEQRMVARTTSEQQGDTVTIDTETKGFKLRSSANPLRAELTLPHLREVSSESVGWTEISGFSGDELELVLDGAGSMKVECNYRIVTATLGGVGSMQIQASNTEGIDLNLQGAGVIKLIGRSKWLKANLGGLGNLNAQHFQVDTVNLELSGLGNASVSARHSANLNVSGLGSVTVFGKPANRSVSVDGLGKVSWK